MSWKRGAAGLSRGRRGDRLRNLSLEIGGHDRLTEQLAEARPLILHNRFQFVEAGDAKHPDVRTPQGRHASQVEAVEAGHEHVCQQQVDGVVEGDGCQPASKRRSGGR
jgi:hypothetical protein